MFSADFHIHSDHESKRGRTEKMQEYVEEVYRHGMTTAGFSEHYWNGAFSGWGKWYQPQTTKQLEEIREAAQKVRLPEGIRIRIGCESEYSKDGVIPLTMEDVRALDYVIVPHSHLNMVGTVTEHSYQKDPKGAARYMVRTFMEVMRHKMAEHITILAHPFVPVGMDEEQDAVLSYITNEEFIQSARAARDMGIALEINSLTWRGKTMEEVEHSEFIRFYRIAREEGCCFTFGSDAHGIRQYQYLPLAEKVAALSGITGEDMHNIP